MRNIYTDWQNRKGFEGKGKLIQHIEDGLPFIFEDANIERQQTYFYCQKWLVELNGYRCRRCILKKVRQRLAPVFEPNEFSKLEDRFISFNDKQIY